MKSISKVLEKKGIKSLDVGQRVEFKAGEITTTVGTATGNAGALGVAYHDGAARTPRVKAKLADFIRRVSVPNATSVEFARANRPDGLNIEAQAGEAATKKLGELQWTLVNNSFVTHAGHVPASRQALKRIPSLLSEIEYELTVDMEKVENAYIADTLIGDSGAQEVDNTDYGTEVVGMELGAAYIVALRKGKTALSTVNATANLIVVNPVDAEKLELARSSEGTFLMLQSVAAGAEPRIFAIPIVESNEIDAGTALVLDTMGMTIYESDSLEFRTSEHNKDNFEKNLVTCLLEKGSVLGVRRPDHIAVVTLPVAGDLSE